LTSLLPFQTAENFLINSISNPYPIMYMLLSPTNLALFLSFNKCLWSAYGVLRIRNITVSKTRHCPFFYRLILGIFWPQ
jgi:hypothetical protein